MRTLIIALLSCAAPARFALAHGDEDHSGPAPAPLSVSAEDSLTKSAVSETFELVLKYQPLSPGTEQILTLFLSDFATNEPVEKAQIEFIAKGPGEAQAAVGESAVHGIYEGKISFPAKGEYQASIRVKAGDLEDAFVIDGIAVGSAGPKPGKSSFLHKGIKWLLIPAFMLVLLAVAIRMKGFFAGWIRSRFHENT